MIPLVSTAQVDYKGFPGWRLNKKMLLSMLYTQQSIYNPEKNIPLYCLCMVAKHRFLTERIACLLQIRKK